MLKPAGFAILIEPQKIEKDLRVSEDSKLVIPEFIKEKQRVECSTGTVLAIGPQAWKDLGTGEPWCNVGDKIMFSKYGGKLYTNEATKEVFVMINDRDVIGVIDE